MPVLGIGGRPARVRALHSGGRLLGSRQAVHAQPARQRPRRPLEGLNASGIAVIVKPERNSPEAGRFARIHDPEGNGIELWEPPSK